MANPTWLSTKRIPPVTIAVTVCDECGKERWDGIGQCGNQRGDGERCTALTPAGKKEMERDYGR